MEGDIVKDPKRRLQELNEELSEVFRSSFRRYDDQHDAGTIPSPYGPQEYKHISDSEAEDLLRDRISISQAKETAMSMLARSATTCFRVRAVYHRRQGRPYHLNTYFIEGTDIFHLLEDDYYLQHGEQEICSIEEAERECFPAVNDKDSPSERQATE